MARWRIGIATVVGLSALATRRPRGGLRRRRGLALSGAGAQARYEWSPQWATYMFVEYERLAGDVANAPLVTHFGSREQIQVGLGATYSFNMHPLW